MLIVHAISCLTITKPWIFFLWSWGVFYNVFLHPLKTIPGPKVFAASGLPYAFNLIKGRWPHVLKGLHDKYGPIVRVGPNDVSFISSAWKEIYGFPTSKHPAFAKDTRIYRGTLTDSPNILIAEDNDHTRMRRLMSHAFSEKALRAQEDIIKFYVDKFILKLAGLCDKKAGGEQWAVVDMVKWYNFVTFDLIGDLAFGEPFGCLDTGGYHPWVALIFEGFRLATLMQVLRRYPRAAGVLQHFIPRKLQEQQRKHQLLSFEKAQTRIAKGSGGRADFMSYILRHNDEKGMSTAEIGENANILIVAGSETTATLLSGTTFWLLRNPTAYQLAADEIRSSFSREEDINMASVSQMKYLLAVLREGLRMYPPLPGGLTRKSPPGGAFVSGVWIPEGTVVSISQWSAYHSAQNFLLPDSFIPERWLEDPRFVGDNREILEPFSYGPRNCLGKNLAYAEMRLVLARMLWNFDLQLQEDSSEWNKQNIYNFHEKPPLKVKLIPRRVQHSAVEMV